MEKNNDVFNLGEDYRVLQRVPYTVRGSVDYPLKLNETRFEAEAHKQGRYIKRYYFSNGLGASVACHSGTYGGHAGFFEVAILKYPIGCDPDITSEIVYDEPINEHLGCVDVIGWRDFFEVADLLQQIRNFNTGEYAYNAK